ncbi:hypothetical protein NJB93_20015 [Brucella intermedia]|uniref:hypothetical protein n=1 Tax=Brucella intermedia TaxID=94625 RepID=UPI00209B9F47|nr:hypothetical protein [Brucella intermedia]MCO7728862.1 hypothetical protein [Brucella intermedia]
MKIIDNTSHLLGDDLRDLTLPIRRETVQGKTVFFVDDNALVACFDRGITEDLVKELAGHEPLRVVFRDNGFVSDAVKINVEQIFRQLSPTTDGTVTLTCAQMRVDV